MNHQTFQKVSSVLVVFASKSQAFDQAALRNLITHAYPGAAVFFISTSGDAVGTEGPRKVDLVIDLTEPGARQGFFFASALKKRAKYTVGRNSGWFFRRKYFNRVYSDADDTAMPKDYLESERWAQRKVLELAGVPVVMQGGLTPDRSKEIALDLPPLQTR